MEIHTKLRGVSFLDRQENIRSLKEGSLLFWKHTPDNPYDKNAVLVFSDSEMTKEVGHLSKDIAAEFVPRIGIKQQQIEVSKVTGGGTFSQGVNVVIKVF